MARDMGPIIKRCRYLGIEPSVLGSSKKLGNRKRRLSSFTAYLKSSSETTIRKLIR